MTSDPASSATGRLSSLPDYPFLLSRLGIALQSGTPATLLFIDIDGIGDVNDRYGHALGDQALLAVCQRLGSALGLHSVLARFAGDEFLVLDEDAQHGRSAIELAERLIARLQQPLILEGRELHVGVTIGVAVSSPAQTRADELVRAAGIALREAKWTIRGSCLLFEPEMATRLTERLTLETELRRAIDRGELRVYYQPQVDLGSGRIAGVEALVRWEHPRRGLISAGTFVPLARQSGLIVPIGDWVLDEACRQLAMWRSELPAARRLNMAINVSAEQAAGRDFGERLVIASQRHGIPLNRLELEGIDWLTREDRDSVVAREALRRRKVGLVLDDFGASATSLLGLRDNPIDRVKIDRRFLTEVESDARARQLVESMVELAGVLGAGVSAVGVETPEQVAFLRAVRVDRAQGFNFVPPLPPMEIHSLLRADRGYELPPPLVLGRAFRRALPRTGTTGPLA